MYLHANPLPGAAQGAAAGSAAGPYGAAIGAAIGAAASLLQGKQHYSPWGFLYDDYPQHIWQNESTIVSLENQLNQLTGKPQIPAPPMYSKTGGAQYQASMQAIVPKYVPGSEQQIANYDRTLNESGGAYEQTVAAQLAIIPQLQQELAQLKGGSIPASPAVTIGQPLVAPYSSAPVTIPQTVAPYSYSLSPTPQTSAQPQQQTALAGFGTPILLGIMGLAALMVMRAPNYPEKKGKR